MNKIIRNTGIATLALASVFALSACSEPNVTTVSSSATASASPTETSADSWPNVVAFVESQWNDEQEKALTLTAKGSPAEKYAEYQIAADEAFRVNGDSGSQAADPTFTYLDDATEGTVTITDSEGTEVVWSDFVVDEQGKIVSWTGESGPLEDALWTKDVTAHSLGATIDLVGAYETNGGSLYIVLDVEAGDKPVTLGYDAGYIEDGRKNSPINGSQPDGAVDTGTSAYYVYVFDGAELGGKFKVDINTDDYMQNGTVSFTVK